MIRRSFHQMNGWPPAGGGWRGRRNSPASATRRWPRSRRPAADGLDRALVLLFRSSGSDFNYDFHVTLDPAVAPVQYNYRDLDELGPDWQGWTGEMHGLTAFLRRGDRVFRTYSSYARGTDLVNSTYQWLDLTARGRQEDWEQPPGRSDGPLMSWLRHHDRYGA
jgi:predicted dithiol-disulfide oxidoreductase (DUF899 family)